MRTPGALVSIALKGPPLAWPGLRSKVSSWLGPPVIQSRMHERRRPGSPAASAARASIQPEVEVAATPAAARRSHWRRVNAGRRSESGRGRELRIGRSLRLRGARLRVGGYAWGGRREFDPSIRSVVHDEL